MGATCWRGEADGDGVQTVVMVSQRCEYSKCHGIVHFKAINFMAYEFQLNYEKKKRFRNILPGAPIAHRCLCSMPPLLGSPPQVTWASPAQLQRDGKHADLMWTQGGLPC